MSIRKHIPFLLERDGCRCMLCREPLDPHREPVHVDHRIPRSKGGSDVRNNLQLAHPFCNQSKGNRMPGTSVQAKLMLGAKTLKECALDALPRLSWPETLKPRLPAQLALPFEALRARLGLTLLKLLSETTFILGGVRPSPTAWVQ